MAVLRMVVIVRSVEVGRHDRNVIRAILLVQKFTIFQTADLSERICLVRLLQLSGQKAVLTRAKNSIANFKLREGQAIGCKVTLRGEKMYEFLDRLVNLALPRVRDFRGVSADSFDGRGNYALGIKEQIIFPEIEYDKIDKVRGMDVIITTTAKTDEEARELLRLFNMPFKK